MLLLLHYKSEDIIELLFHYVHFNIISYYLFLQDSTFIKITIYFQNPDV